MLVKGRDAKTGLPNEVTISSTEMLDAFKRPARQIVDEVLAVLEHSSPELVADIAQTGIVLTGGGAEIRNFAPLLEAVCRLPVRIGTPEGLEGMPTYYNTPANAPITGIVRHGLEYYDALRSGRVIPRGGSPLAGRIRYYWEKIRELFF